MSRLDSLRLELLQAREARAATVTRLGAALPDEHALVFLSLNVPGAAKESPRLDRVFETAREALERKAGALRHTLGAWAFAPEAVPHMYDEGRDALGPWLAVMCPGRADDIKRECIAFEERLPAGRLVDLDVYDRLERQVDRGSLGLPPRRCLVCPETAADCMRVGRHTADELSMAVDRLLHVNDVARLADALVEGARIELELTPKPGLVDRRDNGSHPDLSFELMERSIALLPEYYGELLSLAGLKPCSTGSLAGLKPHSPSSAEAGFHDDRLAACVAAGRRAEERMLAAVGTNAHRGYIFLSGLVLLGFCGCGAAPALFRSRRPEGRRRHLSAARDLSSAIAVVARRAVGLRADSPAGAAQGSSPTRSRAATTRSHGETARLRHRVGGIIGEAVNGLPSIFRRALPALERAEATFGHPETARHVAMAALMTVVDDTTTLHRCGSAGLRRLRRDGSRILEAIEGGEDYVALLETLNEEYRASGMTMGGVADCLAITIAIRTSNEGRSIWKVGR